MRLHAMRIYAIFGCPRLRLGGEGCEAMIVRIVDLVLRRSRHRGCRLDLIRSSMKPNCRPNTLASIETQIAAQNRKIVLLEADWAIETSPERLESFARRFQKQLALRPMESTQIIERHELPQLRSRRTDEEVRDLGRKESTKPQLAVSKR